MKLKHADAEQLEAVLLPAIWRHDGHLGIRELDRLVVGRLLMPSNLSEAIRNMEEKGWIVGVRDVPNTYPRYHITEIGRQVAEQGPDIPLLDAGA